MPQTSPMNWILLSNSILFYLVASSSFFSLFSMEVYKKGYSINFLTKKWMW